MFLDDQPRGCRNRFDPAVGADGDVEPFSGDGEPCEPLVTKPGLTQSDFMTSLRNNVAGTPTPARRGGALTRALLYIYRS